MFIAPKMCDLIVAAADAGRVARVPANYVCDGVDDDVEIHEALDRLGKLHRGIGGTIYLPAGTYRLSRQIARELDNVKICGAGPATRLELDGVTPVISAGTRTGWVLVDFSTDAGGVDVSSAVEAAVGYWRAGKRVSSIASGGIESTPPPGSMRVTNLFVTPDGKFQVDYDDALA